MTIPLYGLRRLLSSLSPPHNFTHIIIGGGVVGLAIARQLALSHPARSTILLERHSAVGTETSSRNSEVIHNGAYYPPGSLKTALCIKGRRLLYAYCAKHYIPHRKPGKWIVAQTPEQLAALEAVYAHATAHGVPLNWLTPAQMAAREPHVRAAAGALESPETGIIDSHALMQSFLRAFMAAGGDVALRCAVTGIGALPGGGYKVTTSTGNENMDITGDVVINSAGLSAVAIGNMLLPVEKHRKAYFCKGTYYVPLSPPPPVRTLIYPAPVPGFGGMGTHLTMDLGGNLRFGPDVQWVDSSEDVAATEAGMAQARVGIQTYLPGIAELRPDYAGMRPKLKPRAGGGVAGVDFWINMEEGRSGFVNLLGIESPGLTSSLAIAEYVEGLLYR